MKPICPTCGQLLVREAPRGIMTFYACTHCKAVYTEAALKMHAKKLMEPFVRAFRKKDGER